jgi:hypothetical protein
LAPSTAQAAGCSVEGSARRPAGRSHGALSPRALRLGSDSIFIVRARTTSFVRFDPTARMLKPTPHPLLFSPAQQPRMDWQERTGCLLCIPNFNRNEPKNWKGAFLERHVCENRPSLALGWRVTVALEGCRPVQILPILSGCSLVVRPHSPREIRVRVEIHDRTLRSAMER